MAAPHDPPPAAEPPLASLAEVYCRGRYARFAQAHREVGLAPFALVRFRQPAGEFPDPPTMDYTLAINEQGRGRMRFDIGTGRWHLPFRTDDLVLKPPGIATQFAVDGPHQKSFLSLPAALVRDLTRAAGAGKSQAGFPDFGSLHAGRFRSHAISRLIGMIWMETAEGNPYGRLFTEGAAMALIGVLLRLSAPAAAKAPLVRPLSPARLKTVLEWMDANLAESFGLAELAAVAGLSPFHFSRAFKAAMGETPRARVTALRIERAKELLSRQDLPLAEIAQFCGFADQSHFTGLFRQWTGMTPGAWRRSQG